MTKRGFYFSLVTVLAVTMPLWVLAQGLVPCTGVEVSGGSSVTSCQFCHVAQLLENISDWLITVLSIIAAIMIGYSGFRLVTSGGNTSAKEEAKRMITNVVIGFVILLAAWLAVDLLMRTLVGGQVGAGPWNSIQCVAQVEADMVRNPIRQWQATLVETAGGRYRVDENGDAVGSCSGVDDCAALAETCTLRGGTPTVNADLTQVTCDNPALAGGGSCDVVTDPNNACSPSNLTCFNNPQGASQVCSLESSGGRTNAVSSTDLCQDGNSFSVGLWQVNLLVNAHLIPGCDGNAAFGGQSQGTCVDRRTNSRGVSYCARWSCRVVNQAAYNNCVRAAQNPANNTAAACSLYETQGRDAWLTSANTCNTSM